MNVLDLFSGIGGFSLGLERAGMRTVAFCEIDPYARAVLRKHWPDVPCYEDVRAVTAARLRADGIHAQVITAGFPCQDISFAGKGAGLAGERSGLWREVARLVGELRPRYAILENVAALLNRGLGDVLGDLAEIGYDCEWHCIPASAVGAPHRRDRWWAIAYPASGGIVSGGWGGGSLCNGGLHSAYGEKRKETERRWYVRHDPYDSNSCEVEMLADTHQQRLEGLGRLLQRAREQSAWSDGEAIQGGRLVKPGVRLLADGIPGRVGQLKAYGNAVVPQIPEIIGRAILAYEDGTTG